MKLAMSIDEFCARTGLCESVAYEEIRAGRLKAKKYGRRTVLLEADVQEFLKSLPDIKLPPKEPRRTKREAA
jgi:excisionase family DNA binding protein